ncbi:hypothetical protein HPULCUR_003290 [Helicostylum pulchrum]|uniref:Nucleolus and neural progenitor protein-like N-terminal domain-containing protein n=1 Tax=Helicostylum pulchrum TaxID=562976 RepID=A0ABP9XSY9_9FUNG
MSLANTPYYTQLNPPLPTNLVLSNVRINKKIDIDHKEQLERLRSYLTMFRERQPFWIEVAVLDRLHYKNLNQQRPFHRFKRGMEVRRLVKRLKVLAMDKEMERLYLTFWNAKTLEKCTGNSNYIPSKECIQYTMHRLIGAALILDKLKVALIETYRANSTLLRLEHFVSMAIVYMGICSRLYHLSHIWVNQIEECYHMLFKWSQCFPSGFKQKDEKAFAASNNLVCEADTLKLARIQFAQNTIRSKSSYQHKIHLESYMANPAVIAKVQEIKDEFNIKSNDDNDDDMMDFEDLGEVIQR